MVRVLPGCLLVVLCLLLPGRAAAGDGELVLSLDPIYSTIDWDQRQPHGGGLALEAQYGLSDSLWLSGTWFYAAHDAKARDTLPAGLLSVGGAFVGLDYSFDVLRVIPFVQLGLGAFLEHGAGYATAMDFGLHAGLGADFLVTRGFSLGLVVRYYAFLTNIDTIPVYLQAGLRVSWRWD